MSVQYDTSDHEEQAIQDQLPGLVSTLERYLEPLLICLDAYLDKRLVRTFVHAIAAILCFRGNQQALQLSELGAYLPGGGKEPAKTKRIQRLLMSQKWTKRLLDFFLWQKADAAVNEMEKAGEQILGIWDGSVVEKAESEKSEGVSSVLSSRAKRLKKAKKGNFNERGGKPITVLGMEWTGVIIIGKKGIPYLVKMLWWSRKGKNATKQQRVEGSILQAICRAWGKRVLHVFDRGYGHGPWLKILERYGAQFVIRWKKGLHFLDENGQEKALSQIVGRTRSQWHKELWNFQKRCLMKTGIVVKRVRHGEYAGDLWVLAVRQKGEPWYLITNVPVETEQDAWKIVFAYRGRWKIETCFRYGKSELRLETICLFEEEKRTKMLLIVMTVYMFLLFLTQENQNSLISWLLLHFCHRTGKKQREQAFPIYRLRWAISRYWSKYPPCFSFSALGDPPKGAGAM